METYVDKVRLGEEGWKERYYRSKFKTSVRDKEFINLIKKSYIEGISWVFQYYYNGCVSWEWFYPFHYAPFASDLVNISDLDIRFQIGEPFKPIEQLLSVLPPFSSKALPACLRNLMLDPCSEIIDFYPKKMELDINGHPYSWMGVNLIPFIDDTRIRKAVEKYNHLFNDEDNLRNSFGQTLVYFKTDHFLFKTVGKDYCNGKFTRGIYTPQFKVFSGVVKGNINSVNPGETYKSNIDNLNIREVRNCKAVSLIYTNPPYKQHESILLEGLQLPKPRISEVNLDFIPKRIFRGDQAIQLVKVSLGIVDDTSGINYSQSIQGQIFDYTYNNNRKFDYTPESVNLLKKKRFVEEQTVKNERNNYYQNNSYNYKNNNNNNNNYNNPTYHNINYTNNNPYMNQMYYQQMNHFNLEPNNPITNPTVSKMKI
jgi:5'-3' exoribonuclease 2